MLCLFTEDIQHSKYTSEYLLQNSLQLWNPFIQFYRYFGIVLSSFTEKKKKDTIMIPIMYQFFLIHWLSTIKFSFQTEI